ncbi:MAG: hypothetical protein IMF05_15255 [Proteobacteria bacterium]|nr:hypothetical protein [Pseudomonadota bacterium]
MNSRRTRTATAILASLCAGGFLPPPAMADDLYDLGEYLSGDCTACHQLQGESKGIPPITGWPVESFVVVMQAYRHGERNDTLMQTVARRFSDEDLEALAVFFGKQ